MLVLQTSGEPFSYSVETIWERISSVKLREDFGPDYLARCLRCLLYYCAIYHLPSKSFMHTTYCGGFNMKSQIGPTLLPIVKAPRRRSQTRIGELSTLS